VVSSRGFPPSLTLAKFNMDKNVSIVKVDKRHYRIIAQENWGLTKEQMRGKHVHHRIRRSDGGTNDPSNLYVCSPWYHDVVWHGGTGGFIELATEAGKTGGASAHIEKDELGRSIHGVRAMEKVHAEKDARGKSVHAAKNANELHSKKDDLGRSLHALKSFADMHTEKNEDGKSVHAVGAGTAAHREKNAEGKSVHGIKTAKKLHSERDDQGRSLHGIRTMEKVHAEKDELGRSAVAMKTNSQVWESTVDGFTSTAAGVVSHNKANGWDPSFRVQVG